MDRSDLFQLKEILTPREYEVFEFVVLFKTNNNGLSPTLREIIKGTSITSTSIANYYVKKLMGRGLIRPKVKWRERGIVLVGEKWSYEPNLEDLLNPQNAPNSV